MKHFANKLLHFPQQRGLENRYFSWIFRSRRATYETESYNSVSYTPKREELTI